MVTLSEPQRQPASRQSWYRFEGLERIESALAGGRRMILFSGHLANWEILPLAAGQYGIDSGLVYRTSNNPFVDRMILKCRGWPREVIPKEAVGRRRYPRCAAGRTC